MKRWRQMIAFSPAARLAVRWGCFHQRICVPGEWLISRGHLWTGRYGERIAASWCRAEGWGILRSNWKMRSGGEIDLVCRDGDCLVFAEVKTRATRKYGPPSRAVDREKRRLIRSGAHEWLRLLHRDDVPYRYDVIEVILEDGMPPDINHLPYAFGEHDR